MSMRKFTSVLIAMMSTILLYGVAWAEDDAAGRFKQMDTQDRGVTVAPVPAPTAPANSAAAKGNELKLAPNAPDHYTVVKGDTLWSISAKFLQQPWRWSEIWNVNKGQIDNPNWIYPGQTLFLVTTPDGPRIVFGKRSDIKTSTEGSVPAFNNGGVSVTGGGYTSGDTIIAPKVDTPSAKQVALGQSDFGAAGRFKFVAGTVKVVSANAEQVAQKGSVLKEGDTIVTDQGGYAQIDMKDRGVVVIRPDTRLQVVAYKTSANGSGGRAIFSLLRGAFRSITGFIGKNTPDNYTVETPAATIGVRGTDHEPKFVPEGGWSGAPDLPPGTYDRVYSGKVVITTKEGQLEVLPGQTGYAPTRNAMPILASLSLSNKMPAQGASGIKEDLQSPSIVKQDSQNLAVNNNLIAQQQQQSFVVPSGFLALYTQYYSYLNGPNGHISPPDFYRNLKALGIKDPSWVVSIASANPGYVSLRFWTSPPTSSGAPQNGTFPLTRSP